MKNTVIIGLGLFIAWYFLLKEKKPKAVAPSVPKENLPDPIVKKIEQAILTMPEPSLINPEQQALQNIQSLVEEPIRPFVENFTPPSLLNSVPAYKVVNDVIDKKLTENNAKVNALTEQSIKDTIISNEKGKEEIKTLLSINAISQTEADRLLEGRKTVDKAIEKALILQESVNLLKQKLPVPTRVRDSRPPWQSVIDSQKNVLSSPGIQANPSAKKSYESTIAAYQKMIDDFTSKYANNPAYEIFT